jgi:hypothetical protein
MEAARAYLLESLHCRVCGALVCLVQLLEPTRSAVWRWRAVMRFKVW